MNINIQRTTDKKYYLHDDFIPAGAGGLLNMNFSGGIQKSDSASYVAEGKLKIMNPHREDRIYLPDHKRIGAGAVFPGQYQMLAMEDTRLRCLHLSKDFDKEQYEFQELFLQPNSPVTLSLTDDIEVAALVFGTVMVSGNEVEAAKLFDVREGDVVLTTLTEATVVYCKYLGT